jgi:hypothetical protein
MEAVMVITHRVRHRVVLGALTAFAVTVAYVDLQAAYLRWASTLVKTGSVSTCFNFANATLTKKGYGSIHKTAAEVNGTKGGVYVAITCVGTAPKATAIVMVMSDNDTLASQARDEVIQMIKGYTLID